MTRRVSDAAENVAESLARQVFGGWLKAGVMSPREEADRVRPGIDECRRLRGGEHEGETSE
jgi:capsid protein